MSSKGTVWHEPATPYLREGWGAVNPLGTVIYFPTEQEARDALAMWEAEKRCEGAWSEQGTSEQRRYADNG